MHGSTGESLKPLRTAILTLAAVAVIEAFSSCAGADEKRPSYVCVSEASAGFSIREGRWKMTDFITNDTFLISPGVTRVLDPGPQDTYSIKMFGRAYAGPCKEVHPYLLPGETKDESSEAISCRVLWPADFYLNVPSLRFLYQYPIGSADGKGDKSNTPYLEIGTCTRI
jgi:hypothetical protein